MVNELESLRWWAGLFQFTPKTIPKAQPHNFTREPKFENVGLAY